MWHMMYMFTKVNRYLFSNSSRSCSSSWMRFLEVFVSLDRWKSKFKLFEMFLANDLFAIGCMMESANRKCGWFWITDYSFVGYLEFTVSKFRQKCKSTFNQLILKLHEIISAVLLLFLKFIIFSLFFIFSHLWQAFNIGLIWLSMEDVYCYIFQE